MPNVLKNCCILFGDDAILYRPAYYLATMQYYTDQSYREMQHYTDQSYRKIQYTDQSYRKMQHYTDQSYRKGYTVITK